MRYDKRATLIKVETVETPLGIEETETRTTLPCTVQNVSLEEQTTIYGQSTTGALKAHFRNRVEGYERVEYDEVTYQIISYRHFSRSTVLYLSRSGY